MCWVEQERLTSVLGEQKGFRVVTPAIVEQASAEHETIDALIHAMQGLIKDAAPVRVFG
jgi:hypothetical protein